MLAKRLLLSDLNSSKTSWASRLARKVSRVFRPTRFRNIEMIREHLTKQVDFAAKYVYGLDFVGRRLQELLQNARTDFDCGRGYGLEDLLFELKKLAVVIAASTPEVLALNDSNQWQQVLQILQVECPFPRKLGISFPFHVKGDVGQRNKRAVSDVSLSETVASDDSLKFTFPRAFPANKDLDRHKIENEREWVARQVVELQHAFGVFKDAWLRAYESSSANVNVVEASLGGQAETLRQATPAQGRGRTFRAIRRAFGLFSRSV